MEMGGMISRRWSGCQVPQSGSAPGNGLRSMGRMGESLLSRTLCVSFVIIVREKYNGKAMREVKSRNYRSFFENTGEDTMIILETEHLLFRPLTLSDLDDLTALYADPEVTRFLGGPRSRDEVQLILNRYIREYELYGHSFFATIQKSDQRFIGQCGLLKQEVEGLPEVELA